MSYLKKKRKKTFVKCNDRLLHKVIEMAKVMQHTRVSVHCTRQYWNSAGNALCAHVRATAAPCLVLSPYHVSGVPPAERASSLDGSR